MSVGVMKDYKLKLRNLRASQTQEQCFHFIRASCVKKEKSISHFFARGKTKLDGLLCFGK